MSSNKFRDFSRYRNNALTNTKILVRSGPATLSGFTVNNPNGSEIFIQMFDAAATGDVTLGSTVCDEPIKVAANGSVAVFQKGPISFFDLGLVIAATTTEGGSTAPASAVSVTLRYN